MPAPAAKKPAKPAAQTAKPANKPFALAAPYPPAGDQPKAIAALLRGVRAGKAKQTLLGVTGSGKTYTMANLIAACNRPAMVLAHNKTLAAQLYAEFREYFPNNAVEYFVSYYDYYQPEAYVPARDLFIEKDSSINEHIEQMRLSATKALMERKDTIIVATVSAIYGIGDPVDYHSMILHLKAGDSPGRREVFKRLAGMQYERAGADFKRGVFRARGDTVDIFPAENAELALRAEFMDDTIEALWLIDPITGKKRRSVPRYTVYPSSHYAAPRGTVRRAIAAIRRELAGRLAHYKKHGRAVEEQRLQERVSFDLEMMETMGFCKGIENYSRHLSGRKAGEPPPTLFDYLPTESLLFVDESHVTTPQIGAMFRGDRSRKETLVEYGFRLPSALDNRPLKFEEFETQMPQTVFVSATPGGYERQHCPRFVEQVIRPTGLVDPAVEVRPAAAQVDDARDEIAKRAAANERVLVTVLTKRMAEQLTQFLTETGARARYLHADIDTVERVEILRDLRLGKFDALVGINLLREGLDLPEVSLVAVFDADKEGFLRSEQSLIQTMGRAARHARGAVILYADKTTDSMRRAMDETARRRKAQLAHNKATGVTPRGVQKAVKNIIEVGEEAPAAAPARRAHRALSEAQLGREIRRLEKQMQEHARRLEFEQAAAVRDDIRLLKESAFGVAPQKN